jgi:uncharacterized protein
MKNISLCFLLIITASITHAQDITGAWNGALKVGGMQLRLVFNIVKTDSGFSSTLDSPDQGAKGIPVTSTAFDGSKLKLSVTNLGIEYNAEFRNNIFTGIFKQNGQTFPLDLSRDSIGKQVLRRPQEPTKPYPYYSEEVSFKNNKANITLAGTLTLPAKEGNYPVVVLITGSGPQNRDEELMGHKPFLVIADYLTRNGIAVLRYDDRGTAQSTGDFNTATSADFADDVESAIAYLKTRQEINKKKIGLIGHSEGGIIAPMVAARSKDVHFIVLLAGTGITGDKLLLLQMAKLERLNGVNETEIEAGQKIFNGAYEVIFKTQPNDTSVKTKVKTYLKENIGNKLPDEQINMISDQVSSPWMKYFLAYNPAPTLEKVQCAVLAINGDKDVQVPAPENLAAIKTALEKGKNKKATIKELPGLNHLFQECKTGSPNEYGTIEQTFSPVALHEITDWIVNQTK